MSHVLSAVVALLGAAPPPLPELHGSIEPSEISVSGLSSGADFVVQLQVAFSGSLKGVGVFAGQPYHCAVHAFPKDELAAGCNGTRPGRAGCTRDTPSPDVPICENCPAGRYPQYDHCKRHPEWVEVPALISGMREEAAAGAIDELSHLAGRRVYLYRGTKDACYLKGSLQNVQTMFEELGSAVQFNKTTPSAHAWPTPDWGPPCGHGVIENCGYDGPGACLQHIYGGSDSMGHGGSLKPPIEAVNASLSLFDQTPFMSPDNNGTSVYNATTPPATGMAPAGFVYVPKACRAVGAACKLHFSFHGCSVNEYYDEAVHHLSFQRWAEANGIVIVYPRLQPHGGTTETQGGCWDAYGQTGADYARRTGVQMAAIAKMIATIAGVSM